MQALEVRLCPAAIWCVAPGYQAPPHLGRRRARRNAHHYAARPRGWSDRPERGGDSAARAIYLSIPAWAAWLSQSRLNLQCPSHAARELGRSVVQIETRMLLN